MIHSFFKITHIVARKSVQNVPIRVIHTFDCVFFNSWISILFCRCSSFVAKVRCAESINLVSWSERIVKLSFVSFFISSICFSTFCILCLSRAIWVFGLSGICFFSYRRTLRLSEIKRKNHKHSSDEILWIYYIQKGKNTKWNCHHYEN